MIVSDSFESGISMDTVNKEKSFLSPWKRKSGLLTGEEITEKLISKPSSFSSSILKIRSERRKRGVNILLGNRSEAAFYF